MYVSCVIIAIINIANNMLNIIGILLLFKMINLAIANHIIGIGSIVVNAIIIIPVMVRITNRSHINIIINAIAVIAIIIINIRIIKFNINILIFYCYYYK